MALNRSKTPAKSAKSASRPTLTFAMAVQLCPHEGAANAVAQAFGLIVPEYEEIREQHEKALRQMWLSFDEALNEKATAMHFQRLVGSMVASAVGAGRFYSDKVSEARAATARGGDGGADQEAPAGLESKAQRIREFAAEMAMQSYALLAAAQGAVNAYKEITGEDWKAYQAQAEGAAAMEKRSAEAQLGAFG